MRNRKVTICACISRSFIDKEKVADIAVTLTNNGYDVTVEADLCQKVIQAPEEMKEIAAGTILACYPRAIRSHLDWLGIDAAADVIDIRSAGYPEIMASLQIDDTDSKDVDGKEDFRKEIAGFPVENGTDAWYPVLDKTRCSECGKCHDFCLFGVYTIEDRKVKVVHPQNCKNNCPACARMCPSKAIIFPKYEKSPINGGMAQEETFNPEEMNKMYQERLRMRLQQRRAGISLLNNNS